jgi:4-hydroxy-tetrahydrodipicolinate reductase
MGQAIARAVAAQGDLALAGIWQRGGDLGAVVSGADVLVDFSLPGATREVLDAVTRSGTPLVCGVTGLGDDLVAALAAAAETVPVVYDRNMSLGIAVLESIAAQAARALGTGFGVEVHETHHVHKIDAPSGTALKLGEAVAQARGEDPAAMHYESERRGEVPGDHTVIFTSPAERLQLGHSVSRREVFADGALRAARWVVSRQAGLYSMHDVLDLDH